MWSAPTNPNAPVPKPERADATPMRTGPATVRRADVPVLAKATGSATAMPDVPAPTGAKAKVPVAATTRPRSDGTPAQVKSAATKPRGDATPVPTAAATKPAPAKVTANTKPRGDATPAPAKPAPAKPVVASTKPRTDATPAPAKPVTPAKSSFDDGVDDAWDESPKVPIAPVFALPYDDLEIPVEKAPPPRTVTLPRMPVVVVPALAPKPVPAPVAAAAPTGELELGRITTNATKPAPMPAPSLELAPFTAPPDGWSPKEATAPLSASWDDGFGFEKREPSVIIDLNAKADPHGADSAPSQPVVMQTSERSATASGVFEMPTAASPNAKPHPSTHVVPAEPEPLAEPPRLAAWSEPMTGTDIPTPSIATNPALAALPRDSQPVMPPARDSYVAMQPEPQPHADSVPPRFSPQAKRFAIIGATAVACLAVVLTVAMATGNHDDRAASSSSSAPAVADTKAVAPTAPAAAVDTQPAPAAAPVEQPAAADPTTPPPTKAAPTRAPARRVAAAKPVVLDYDKPPVAAEPTNDGLARARVAYTLGNQHLFAGETGAAVQAYQQALAAYPNYAAGYRGLGLAYAQQGDRVAAIHAFKQYVQLVPNAKDVALIKKRMNHLATQH